MMGVEIVDKRSSTKAAKNSIDKGVAGRSMMASNGASLGRRARSPRRFQDAQAVVVRECDVCSVGGPVGVRRRSMLRVRVCNCRRRLHAALRGNERRIGTGRCLHWHWDCDCKCQQIVVSSVFQSKRRAVRAAEVWRETEFPGWRCCAKETGKPITQPGHGTEAG